MTHTIAATPPSGPDLDDDTALRLIQDLEDLLRRPPGRHKVAEHLNVGESKARRLLTLHQARRQQSAASTPEPRLHVVPPASPQPMASPLPDDGAASNVAAPPSRGDAEPQHRPEDGSPTPGTRAAETAAPPDPGTAAHTTPDGAVGFYLVFGMSLLVSFDTSWRLFGWLGITAMWERAVMFTVLDVALIACGVAMHASVKRSGRPGPARLLAWTLCGVAAFGAIVLSGPIAGALRVILGPVLGLVTLHLAIGIEIRANHSTTSTTWSRVRRELRERLLSRIGLANDDRDALARTRDRAASRAARLALASRWMPFRGTRLNRALRASDVAHDVARRRRLLSELAAVRHADALTSLKQPSPWDQSYVKEAT